jgi:hypothetical protein
MSVSQQKLFNYEYKIATNTLVQNQWMKLRGTRVQYGFLLHTNCFLLINMLENFIKFENFQKIWKS